MGCYSTKTNSRNHCYLTAPKQKLQVNVSSLVLLPLQRKKPSSYSVLSSSGTQTLPPRLPFSQKFPHSGLQKQFGVSSPFCPSQVFLFPSPNLKTAESILPISCHPAFTPSLQSQLHPLAHSSSIPFPLQPMGFNHTHTVNSPDPDVGTCSSLLLLLSLVKIQFPTHKVPHI